MCNFDTQNPQHIVVDISPFLGTDGPFPCTELLSGETQIFPQSRLELLLQVCAAQVQRFPDSKEYGKKGDRPLISQDNPGSVFLINPRISTTATIVIAMAAAKKMLR